MMSIPLLRWDRMLVMCTEYVCTIIWVPLVYDLLGFCSFIGVSDEKGGTSHRHRLDFPVYITLSLLFPLFVPYVESKF